MSQAEADTIPMGEVWTVVKGQPSVPKGAILEILGTLVVLPETDKEDLNRSENISRLESVYGMEERYDPSRG